MNPVFLKAKAAKSKEDNPKWQQTMNEPYTDEYCQAACKNIETLEGTDAWDLVDKKPGMNIISSLWAFKLKRLPDGFIKKFKTHF